MGVGGKRIWRKGEGDREGRLMMFSCSAVLRVLLVLTGIGACCQVWGIGLGDRLWYRVDGE